jgi:hypothetical protein
MVGQSLPRTDEQEGWTNRVLPLPKLHSATVASRLPASVSQKTAHCGKSERKPMPISEQDAYEIGGPL